MRSVICRALLRRGTLEVTTRRALLRCGAGSSALSSRDTREQRVAEVALAAFVSIRSTTRDDARQGNGPAHGLGSSAGSARRSCSSAPSEDSDEKGNGAIDHGFEAPSALERSARWELRIGRCPTHPASLHARVALSAPSLRDYKELHADAAGAHVTIRSAARKVEEAARSQKTALLADADLAADTLGHIHYFGATGANQVLEVSVRKMEQRQVIKSALNQAQRELARVSGRVEVGAGATRSVATSIGE